ncbi:Heparin-sulfate lyase precursor [Vibrio campbellii]|nr:Heparin-sulfate lyase precursor [Vibrio campbellii]
MWFTLSYIEKLFLTINTIKYLRFEQILYRLIFKFKKPKLRKLHKVENASVQKNNWEWTGPCLHKRSFISREKVFFLNKPGVVDSQQSWNDSSHDKLWLYNLHYFDDLNAIDFDKRRDVQVYLMTLWINDNPPCIGNGWEPYPISLRIVNWIKWLSREEFNGSKFLISLAQQVHALSQQIEYHIQGNHLFANAKALVFSGCFFHECVGGNYLDLGLKILDREIPEQFLEDGAHFELSPMYHEILLWDLLELIDLAKTSNSPKLLERLQSWEDVARRGLSWLKNMIHPDGEVSFFNDSAIGIAPTPKQIFDYASKLDLTVEDNTAFLIINRCSGYSRISVADFVCLFDHANIGPDYLPGHAHADSLSFELSVCEQRVFVNSGTSLYGTSKERQRQRGTSAHNTVVVDNQNSSEVWSGFRVARRAYSKLLDSGLTENGCFVKACHDGYKRLSGKVQHTRRIDIDTNKVIVSDKLSGTFQSAQVHYHLHPDIEIEVQSSSLLLRLPNGESLTLDCNDKVLITESTWHPKFGESIPNKKLIFTLSSDQHDLLIIRNN